MMIPTLGIHRGRVVRVMGATGEMTGEWDASELMPRYALSGEVTLVDLDAAMGQGDNRGMITKLLATYPCRVAGGIRTADDAIAMLDAGAEKVIVGTGADTGMLGALPKSRILAAVDVKGGSVVVKGGGETLGQKMEARIEQLRSRVAGVVVTAFDTMGTMDGIDMALVESAKSAAGKGCSVTVAGGVGAPSQIAALDKLGADVHVGAALHTGALDLADGIVAPIKTDRPDGLFATVVVDELGQAIGLVYSDMESIREAVKRKMGAYHSRSRGLWVKGLTSGNTQELLGVKLDCDRDALYFTVTQTGAGFCHNDTWSCWGEDQGIGRVARMRRGESADKVAVTETLVAAAKTLGEASDETATVAAAAEAMDMVLKLMAAKGIDFKTVETALYKRGLRVSDRPNRG